MPSNYDPQCHHRRSIRKRGYDYTQPGAYFVTICTPQRRFLFNNAIMRRIAEEQWEALNSAGQRGIRSGGVSVDAWVVMPNHVHGIIVIHGGVQQPGSYGDEGAWEAAAPVPGGGMQQLRGAGVGGNGAGGGMQQLRGAGAGGDGAGGQQPGSYGDEGAGEAAAPVLGAPARASDFDDLALYDEAALLRPARRPGGKPWEMVVPPGSLGAVVRSYKAAVSRRVHKYGHISGVTVWQRGYWDVIIRDQPHMDRVRQYIADNPRKWRIRMAQLDDLLARMNYHDD